MVDETNAVAPETTEAQATPPEEDINTIKAKIEELNKSLDAAKQEAEKAKQEALTHQRGASKLDRELKEAKARDARIDGIENKMDVLTAMLADLVDSQTTEVQQPVAKRSEAYLSRLKKEEPKPQPKQDAPPPEWDEAVSMATKAGLNLLESDELALAYRYFVRGSYDKGLDAVRKAVEAKNPTPKVKTQEEIEKEAEERAMEILRKKGLLTADAGKSVGKGMTRQEAIAKYAQGEMSTEEIVKLGYL